MHDSVGVGIAVIDFKITKKANPLFSQAEMLPASHPSPPTPADPSY
jgi:hypothetical protein